VRAHLESGVLPWSDAAISGWILDPDRKKMSKSKGNVVTPMGLLDEHGSDAVRYWAASGRPGTDTAFDVGQMKIGRRLAIKVLNASKFALSLKAFTDGAAADVTEPLDRAMLSQLSTVVADATEAFESYNYTKALEVAEQFFWQFCDDYVELVKDRVYNDANAAGQKSGRLALGIATETYLKLFAPFLPFVTDEVWSWWKTDSVHNSQWPAAAQVAAFAHGADPKTMDAVSSVVSQIRKIKSDAQVSMRTEISSAVITAPAAVLGLARNVASDLLIGTRVQSAEWVEGTEVSATGELVIEPK
jgi:valyl-tRNA synthetase